MDEADVGSRLSCGYELLHAPEVSVELVVVGGGGVASSELTEVRGVVAGPRSAAVAVPTTPDVPDDLLETGRVQLVRLAQVVLRRVVEQRHGRSGFAGEHLVQQLGPARVEAV